MEPIWLCTNYKIDWTALSILAALVTAIFGWWERQRRLNATAVVIGALLLVDLEQMTHRIAFVRDNLLPRTIALGNESIHSVVTCDDIASDPKQLNSLLQALTGLGVPGFEKYIDKLDTLPATYTFEVAALLVEVEQMRLIAENADKLVRERNEGIDDAKHHLGPGQNIDQIADIATALPQKLWRLRKRLTAHIKDASTP